MTQTGTGAPAWSVEVEAVQELSRRLLACSKALETCANGLDQTVPEIPEDEHEVGRKFKELDGARSAFDRRLSTTCREASSRLALLVLEARRADANSGFVHLPEAGY